MNERGLVWRRWLLTLLLVVAMASPAAVQEGPQKGGEDQTGPYDLVSGWFKPVEEGVTTYVISVFAESPDRIYAVSTGATPGDLQGTFDPDDPGAELDHMMLVLDGDGRVIEEWRQHYQRWGNLHGARVNPYDPERHVWVIDRESHTITQLTRDGGEIVKVLGEPGVTAVDEEHFGRPAEIVWMPDGTSFVADGYGNRRVVKLDSDGNYITSWGSEGSGPGQFGGTVHCVAVDHERGVVYVSDSGNSRIQLFDLDGEFIEEWPNINSPSHIVVMQDSSVWVSDLQTARILKYSPEGELLTYWGVAGTREGTFQGLHDFHVDSDGNLYLNQALAHRIDKYTPKPNADEARLIGQPMR